MTDISRTVHVKLEMSEISAQRVIEKSLYKIYTTSLKMTDKLSLIQNGYQNSKNGASYTKKERKVGPFM